MLLEEGFEVQSADISDKMLKQAYKTRWERRKEDLFDQWSMYHIITSFSGCNFELAIN